jgi:aromatic ring-opening dioxygenase catalytic subunit (LigB family)
MASSHAFTLMDPGTWDTFRLQNRQSYERRYGQLPVEHAAEIAGETDELVRARYERIDGALAQLRSTLERQRPDAIIIVADDQDENFTNTIPQFGIYLGEEFRIDRSDSAPRVLGHPVLANAILESCVRSDIDLTAVYAFPDDHLRAHAVGPVLRVIDPGARIPVVPIFVNAIHEPAPSPARCFHVGQVIRSAVEACAGVGSVCIYASGGLSHFTAGYPWRRYHGDMTHGAIDEDFDRQLISAMLENHGADLARLTSDDLLRHGEIEFRTWLVALGALRDATPDFIEYQPFYRGLMGMCVGAWTAPSPD